MNGRGRTILPEPLTFCLGQRIMAQSVLANKTAMVQQFLNMTKFSGGRSIAAGFDYLPRERHDKSEPVLKVSNPGFAHQPSPVQVAMLDDEPWQRLNHAYLEICGSNRRQKDDRGIVNGPPS